MWALVPQVGENRFGDDVRQPAQNVEDGMAILLAVQKRAPFSIPVRTTSSGGCRSWAGI
jgi:hypothetical protein